MIRTYCDGCGTEVARNFVRQRLSRSKENFKVEVQVATDGVWNDGHICFSCLLRVINEGVDVPSE